MNPKSLGSLNIAKTDIIDMAEDKARTPREYINQVLRLDSSGVRNVDNFLEGLSAIESDGKNLAHGSNKKSSAGGFFQFLNSDGDNGGFDGSSLDTALTRMAGVYKVLGKKLPKKFADARTNKSVTGLGYDDQALLTLVNLQQNPASTNKLLEAVGRGDTGAARDLYKNFHLTQVNTGAEQFEKINKKVEREFGSRLVPEQGAQDPVNALEVEGEEPGNIESIIRAYEYADKLPKSERRSKVGQTVDVAGSMVGLGPDRERVAQAGDTAADIARELGVRVEDLGGLGDDPDLIYPEQVFTAPPEDTTLEEDWEELKKIWGLYEGGVVDHSNVSSRIQNIMKPKD
jgi:hypothetical protein